MGDAPDPPRMEADVLIGAKAPADHERLLEETLPGLGVTARTRVAPTRRGVAELS
jgi:hypothetical protein